MRRANDPDEEGGKIFLDIEDDICKDPLAYTKVP